MAYVSCPFDFPFCIFSGGSSGTDVPTPIAMSRSLLTEWYWRIRQWTVTITPDDPVVGGPETQIYSVVPTIETDFVCMGSSPLLDQIQDFEFPDVGLTVNFRFRLFGDEGAGAPAVTGGGNFYPTIYATDQSEVPIKDILSTSSTSFSARIETDVIFADVTFAASLWWAYNPGSGGDVWATGDGSQLRSPWSIQQAG